MAITTYSSTSTSSDPTSGSSKKHSRSTSSSSSSMNDLTQPGPSSATTNHSSKRLKLKSDRFIQLLSNHPNRTHHSNPKPKKPPQPSPPPPASSSSTHPKKTTNDKTITIGSGTDSGSVSPSDSDVESASQAEAEPKAEAESPTGSDQSKFQPESEDESEWITVTKNQKKSAMMIIDQQQQQQTDKPLSKSQSKKKEKLNQKIIDNPAEFHYDTRGFRHGRMIQLKDVRDLVLSIMSDERNQEWMLVKNKSSIKKMVVLMIPGLTSDSLGITKPENTSSIMPFPITSKSSKLPIFQSLFSHACPTKAGGDRLRMFSCLNVFLTCQLSAMAKVKRDEERKKSSMNGLSMDPTSYLLSTELMMEQDYPSLHYPTPFSTSDRQAARTKELVSDRQAPLTTPCPPFEAWLTHPTPGFIQTPIGTDSSLGRPLKILGIDCEMCVTASGSELTRCTIVDADERLVYDQLVLPDQPITDYLTRFSGITEERLKGTTTRLIDVQRKLSELIDFNTVLVGHSLDCDLRALKIAHPWVIDTSVIYQHPRGLPMKPSLKWLASKWLGREIQSNGLPNGGHDSEEDARTAVQLLKKKMEKGRGFGEFTSDTESIFERISRGNQPKRSAFVDFWSPNSAPPPPNPSSDSTPPVAPKVIHPHQQHPIVMKNNWKNVDSFLFGSDRQVADGVISALDDHDFVFGRFMELSHALGWTQNQSTTRKEGEGISDATKEEARDSEREGLSRAYKSLNETLERLNERLPRGSSLIIFNGHSDPRRMAELNLKKSRFERSFHHSHHRSSMNHSHHHHHHQSLSSTLLTIGQPFHPAQQQQRKPDEAVPNPSPLAPPLQNDQAPAVTLDHASLLEDKWSNQDERDLADAVERCKIGMSFYRIK